MGNRALLHWTHPGSADLKTIHNLEPHFDDTSKFIVDAQSDMWSSVVEDAVKNVVERDLVKDVDHRCSRKCVRTFSIMTVSFVGFTAAYCFGDSFWLPRSALSCPPTRAGDSLASIFAAFFLLRSSVFGFDRMAEGTEAILRSTRLDASRRYLTSFRREFGFF